MHRPIRLGLVVLLTFAFSQVAMAQTLTRASGGELVELVRDDVGVPHVFASSARGAFYGLGWASAQDRLLQLDIQRRLGRGRIAEVLSPSMFPRAVASDKRARRLGLGAHADRVAAALTDRDAQRALRSYCEGVNDYVASLGGSLPPVFQALGITTFVPWTPGDCLVVWMRVQDVFDTAWEGEANSTSCPPGSLVIDPTGAVVSCPFGPAFCRRSGSELLFAHTYPNGEMPKASHNWTVAGSHTTSGKAVLHSDPQLLIQAPSFWYEFHVQGGGYDCRGMGVPGFPPVFIGWNRRVAWGATALGGDASDLYEMQPGVAPDTYVLDGVETPMSDVHDEVIQVKGGAPVAVRYRGTVFGPVVTDQLVDSCHLPPSTTRLLAVQHLMLFDDARHSIEGLLSLMRARDWCEARAAIRGYRSPAIHFLYADADGHIGYTALSHIPIRPPGDPCFGKIPLDGTTIASAWQGTIPLEQMPWAFDPPQGFLSTANNMAADPSCTPLGLVIGGTGDTIRSWRLREVLEGSLAGGAKMTPAEVLDVHKDAVNPALRVFAQLAIEMLDVGVFPPRSDAQKAASALANDWNVHLPASKEWSAFSWLPSYPLLEDLEAVLVSTFRQPLSFAITYGGGQPGLCHFLKDVPRDLPTWAANAEARTWASNLLETAWRSSQGRGVDGFFEVLYLGRLRQPLCGAVCSNGQDCSLFSAFDFTSSAPLQVLMGNTIWSQQGNSYSQWVDFSDLDASKSILPPGISEDPSSPTFRVNEAGWLAGELNPGAALDEAIVKTKATSKELLLYTGGQ